MCQNRFGQLILSIGFHVKGLQKSPEEIWSKKKPDLLMLRVFGCRAFAQVPAAKRKKLDDKSIECIFIGYATNAKAYRLYNNNTNSVITSRNVILLESSGPVKVNNSEIDKSNRFCLQYSEDEQSEVGSCESVGNMSQREPIDDSQTVILSPNVSFPKKQLLQHRMVHLTTKIVVHRRTSQR